MRSVASSRAISAACSIPSGRLTDHRPRRERDPLPRIFLAWGEALMEPMSPAMAAQVVASLHVFEGELRKERPDLPSAYLEVVRAGWLHIGIGSAEDLKFLVRVQGPSDNPGDDELLEAKRAADLIGLPCLDVAAVPPASRIVLGVRHIGRLANTILIAAPEAPASEPGTNPKGLGHWFLRSWDPTYKVCVRIFARAGTCRIAHDARRPARRGQRPEAGGGPRPATRDARLIQRLERRFRIEARRAVDELMRGWEEIGAEVRK